MASRTGTIENFGLDTVEHAGIQLSGIQPYGIRLFRVVGGIETGNPLRSLLMTQTSICVTSLGIPAKTMFIVPSAVWLILCRLCESIVRGESGQYDAVTAWPGIYPVDLGG